MFIFEHINLEHVIQYHNKTNSHLHMLIKDLPVALKKSTVVYSNNINQLIGIIRCQSSLNIVSKHVNYATHIENTYPHIEVCSICRSD